MSFRPVILCLAALSLWVVVKNAPETKTAVPATKVAETISKAATPAASQVIQVQPVQTPSLISKPALVKPLKAIYVSGDRVALRKAPDMKSEVLDRLNNGFQVMEIERSNDWIKVRHPLTQVEGYVSASRLRDSPPIKKEDEVKTLTKTDKAIVLTAAAITTLLIAQSVASYRASRPCACPYNETRTGASCGARSAWSRPGGAKPLCYPDDVTSAMIAGYRASVR